MQKKFYYAKPEKRFGDDRNHPWLYTLPAYRVSPHVWNVGGQDDIACYLIDTGDGLILIDTGWTEGVYLIIDRIYSLGFNPRDIKKILLTHWHWDHTQGAGQLKQISDADVYISKEDQKWVEMYKEKDDPEYLPEFQIDYNYDFDEGISLGGFHIELVPTPGHDPGTVSFFFTDVDEEDGSKYKVGLHGGLGTFTMKLAYIKEHSIDEDIAFKFIEQSEELAEREIDICLPSHLNQGNIKPSIPEDTNDYKCFVADYLWKDMLLNRVDDVKSFYPDKYEI